MLTASWEGSSSYYIIRGLNRDSQIYIVLEDLIAVVFLSFT